MAVAPRLLGLVIACLVVVHSGVGAQVASSGPGLSRDVPELPRILSARTVLGTQYGTAVRVRFCFASWPSDPTARPGRLHLAVDNLTDDLGPLGVGWTIKSRCGTIVHPVGPIQQPLVLRYSVESTHGTFSERDGQIRLAELPVLNRKPALPQRIEARLVTGTRYGKALRISYCFRSLPTDRARRPWRLQITILSARDRLQGESYVERVETRCGTLTYPVTGIDPPYVVTYVVVSKIETRTKRTRIAVR